MGGVTSLGNASGESVIGLGEKAWNIADGFTKIKILKILIELDPLTRQSKGPTKIFSQKLGIFLANFPVNFP